MASASSGVVSASVFVSGLVGFMWRAWVMEEKRARPLSFWRVQGLLAIFLLLCGFVFYIWLRIEAENDCNGIVVRGSTGAMTACVENVR
jgi:hypothetical protein